jgi:tetratricopeptide (TPR) repeat protein
LPQRRLHDYFLLAATVACDLIGREARRFEPVVEHRPRSLPDLPDLDAAVRWLTTERPTLLAVAADSGDWQLACALRAYFENGGHFADWRATHEAALHGNGSDRGRALIQFNLGALAMWTDRPAEGLDHFRSALAYSADDHQSRAAILTSQGMLAHQLFHDEEAAGYLREALSIDHDYPRITALGWNNLGLVEGRLGLRTQALEHHRRALALARQIDSPAAERGILLGLGETSLRLGVDAEAPFRLALELARSARFRMQEALALDGLAHATGDPQFWQQALEIFTELAAPRSALTRAHLDSPGTECCDLCRPVPGLVRT